MNELAHGVWTKEDVFDLNRLAGRIAAGADIGHDYGAIGLWTLPLGLAAYYGRIDACRMLLEAGADPNKGSAASSPFDSILHMRKAWRDGEADAIDLSVADMKAIFTLLLEYGGKPESSSDPDRPMKKTDSPLYRAAALEDHAAVRLLVEIGMNVDEPVQGKIWDRFDHTQPIIFWLRAMRDNFDNKTTLAAQRMIVTFLDLGADDSCIALPDHGWTAFQAQVNEGNSPVVEYYVRERGEDPAQRTGHGKTLFQIAKSKETKELLRSLKTELAIQKSVDTKGKDPQPNRVMAKGMAPL